MKRVDADDFGRMPAAAPLFDPPTDAEQGCFAFSKITPEAIERTIGGIIWTRQGRKNPIGLKQLCSITGQSERRVKDVVEQLVVTHNVLVGAVRSTRDGGGVGYCIICDGEDLEACCGPFESQIMTMHKRLSKLRKMAAARGITGQSRLTALVLGNDEGSSGDGGVGRRGGDGAGGSAELSADGGAGDDGDAGGDSGGACGGLSAD